MQKKYTVGLIAASLIGSAHAGEKPFDVSALKALDITPEVQSINHNKITKVLRASQEQYFIVRLQERPLAAMGFARAASQSGNQLNTQTASAQAHMNVLAQERAAFATRLSTLSVPAQIGRHYDAVMNAVVVRAKSDIYNELANMPGVSKVYRNQMRHTTMDTSPSLIKATEVWESMGGKENAGKGVRVAVIDTGIRPEHPMFSNDAGFDAPGALLGNDYCSIAPDFCNNKLIVARAATPTFETHADEHLTPLGYRTHGTHVAGTSVGNHVATDFRGNAVELSGIAPGAYLMAYKGLYGTPEGQGSGSDVMLVEMLDWAVKDGADVINNSWGGGVGSHPDDSPYKEAFQTAQDAGVVVVTSAGNSGPGPQTIGCPSCVEPGLSVASSVHGRFFANTATFGSLTGLLAIPSAATTLSEDITGTVVASLTADPENFEGCNAFPADSFTGNIALISRGACSFFDKINNAEAAGATAVIIYNNRAGAPIVQGGVDGINIPSIMISQTDGLAILEMLSDEVNQVTIGHATERVMVAESIDAMSGFSSRGPNGDQNSLKPDITAPGSNILSGVSPEDSGGDTYGILSGTSMAAPHISGAAAIMRQTFPDWSAIDIKTAMTSTSKMGLKKEDYVTATDAFDVGAGRIDLSTSTMAAATFDKPSMAMNPCIVTCNFTRTINNKMDHEMTWTATVTFDDPAFTGSVYPSTVTLGAMGGDDPDAEFVVKVDGSNSDVEGWAFGQVTWTNSMGAAMHPDAHMAIAVAIDRSILGTTATGSGGIGDTMQMTSLFTNTNDMFEEQVRIDIKAPMGTKIVAGSETSALNEATQFALDNDDVANRLSWTGTFNKAAFVTEAIAAPIGGSIADFGASLINCGDACDDVSTDIDLSGNDLSFAYNGQRYSALSISSNGYIILGGGDARTASNQDLPSADEPNNVIAPFWTDLDLSKNDSGTGGGDMYIGLFDLGPAVYVGIEWKDAQLWGDDTGKKYNFQAWISTGETQDVFFEYGLLDATLPARLTVGAEDGQGVTGSSFHFNGAGNAVMGDSGVQVSTAPAGNVQLGYDIQVTGPLNLGVADTIDTSEDAAASSVTPLANDKTTDDKVIDIKFSHAGKSFSTPKTIQTTAEGELDVTSLMIVTQPMHGAATDNGDGTFSYTAEADFNGMDSFTYDAADAAGVRMAPTTVWVNVASVNDVPVFTAETPTEASGTEGGSVTLTASATDVDSEELTYSWAQTAGTEAVLAGADTGEVTITLPEVAAGGETLSFTVSANDGTDTVDHVVAVTVADVPPPVVAPTTTNRSGGGSTGLLALLLMPLAFVRRRLAK